MAVRRPPGAAGPGAGGGAPPARGGALVLGGPGVGKTACVRRCLGPLWRAARWMFGAQATAGVPLGAFAPVLPEPASPPPSPTSACSPASYEGETFSVTDCKGNKKTFHFLANS